jgi:putative transposase
MHKVRRYVYFEPTIADMPNPRFLVHNNKFSVHYHCVSRVVDRNFVFGVHERDVFRKILRQVEAFSGVRVVTWTILSNHFHVLLEVPPRPIEEPDDAEILERCRLLYTKDSMIAVEWEFQDAQRIGGSPHRRVREKYLRRMWDLSEFMKTLKQKFTGWFNRKYDRAGTLWESRFKSVIVEGHWNALLKVAAYIDLNAVRAGMVEDPKDYCWCGYGEAVGGDRLARKGLAAALSEEKPNADWRDVGPRYRKIIFGIGEEHSVRAGISREEVAKVWEAGGKLSLAQLLRCRIRYFTDGLAIGSESFVERIFEMMRGAFSEGRERGARKMKGGDWGELRTARDLRVTPISISPGGDG